MAKELFLNGAGIPIKFMMIDSADHITGKTGLAPTVVIEKNGGTFGAPAGAITERAFGWYQIAGNATDCNTAGPLIVHASAVGADPCDDPWQVKGINPSAILVDANLIQIAGSAADVATLVAIIRAGLVGVVSTAVNAGSPTAFRCANITTPGAHFYEGKQVVAVSGANALQYWGIVTGYSLISGEGAFVCSPGSPTGTALLTGAQVYIG